MNTPSAEELAAIAAACAIVAQRRIVEPRAGASRWRLAAAFDDTDAVRARIAARARSRWSIAGGLDD